MKKKNFLLNTLLLILFIFIIYNTNKYISINKEIKSINKNIKITKVVDDKNKLIYKTKTNKSLIDYTNMSMTKINLDYFINKNQNTMGFIYIPNTKVKHLIMNDEYYLNHNFNKNNSFVGLPYIYNKNKNLTDKNNILITKQKSFNEVLKNDFLQNDKNLIIKINTKENVSLWQIVSIYKTNKITYKTSFSNEEFLNFKNDILLNSTYSFNSTIEEDDILLTIILKENTNKVIVAKLIKMQNL